MNIFGANLDEMLSLPTQVKAPLRALSKALTSPSLARSHPLSRDLRTFLANGYEIVDFTLTPEPPEVDITLRKGSDERRLNSDDLVFVSYAATAVPRERARANLKNEENGGNS